MKKKYFINIGDIYGELTVIKYVGKNKYYNDIYLCKCSCGNEKEIIGYHLATGNTKTCGCGKAKRFYKHGLSKTKIYVIWQQIIERCYTKTCVNYNKYGARGITVCEDWKNKETGFVNFNEWAMNNGYKEGLTIDRINTNGNYEPQNCRWATYETQNTNLNMLKTNKSGYRGCFYLKKYNKWLANISINNKTVSIGTYNTLKECVEARNKYIENNNLPHQKNIWRDEDVN